MPGKSSLEAASIGAAAAAKRRADAHRRYNRAYMRRWRASPLHRDHELAMRLEWYYARKLRNATRKRREHTNHRGEPVCAICCRRPPVTQVTRLQINEASRSGFEEVLIPYCGEC